MRSWGMDKTTFKVTITHKNYTDAKNRDIDLDLGTSKYPRTIF
jgi:hypothetical protein